VREKGGKLQVEQEQLLLRWSKASMTTAANRQIKEKVMISQRATVSNMNTEEV
jgi:hypothetical protein